MAFIRADEVTQVTPTFSGSLDNCFVICNSGASTWSFSNINDPEKWDVLNFEN